MIRSGGFEIRAVETGRLRLDGGAMFGVVPKALWERTDPADERNRIAMHMRALYAQGHGRRILVDAGAGAKLDAKMVEIYDIDSRPLRDALAESGIDPDTITDVIVTHLHFDHAGGLTCFDADGRLRPALPGAVHHIQRRQWEAAVRPNDKDRASFFAEDFLPLAEFGKLRLADGETEVAPGVRVVPTDGHTPGHQVVLLGSGSETVMYCGDLVPLASHLSLPWIMAYDHLPLSTLEEKKRLLSAAADEGWILFFEHDPSIAACRIRRGERGRFEVAETIPTG